MRGRGLAMLAVMVVTAMPAAAGDGVEGDWQGRYVCGQGITGMTLTIDQLAGTKIRALFRFYAASVNPGVPQGCFEMTGSFDPATRQMRLQAGRWRLHPAGYVTVDLSGRLGGQGDDLAGSVIGPYCSSFALHRVAPGERVAAPSCDGAAVSSLQSATTGLPR